MGMRITFRDCHRLSESRSQVVTNVGLLKADLKKGFIICGESAGGNLSAVLSHMARDDPFFHDSPLTGQFLCEPNVCHYEAYPER